MTATGTGAVGKSRLPALGTSTPLRRDQAVMGAALVPLAFGSSSLGYRHLLLLLLLLRRRRQVENPRNEGRLLT